MRRKLHGKAMFRAWQLLNVQGNHGYIWLRDTWRERLELAGIDPESMLVIDQRRWARAWKMLVDTWRFRKADAIGGNTLDEDAPWPPEPVIRGPRKCPRTPKTEPKPEREPARKFDPTARFRRTIWSPSQEQMLEGASAADCREYEEPSHCSMPIPDEQDGYGTVIQIHNPSSW
jgi:hypothetical protein